MAATRVLVFADCGPRVGGGHVMRCLTLARALMARGADCVFAATPDAQAVLRAFGAPDIVVHPVPDAAAAAAALEADWALLDHYDLSVDQEAAFRKGRRLAVLDDLADRPRGADLVLDSAYGRTPETYRALTPPGAVILTGPPYAPVRPEFVRLRPAALARRREGAAPRRVLIALGLTDVNAVTGRVVAAVRPVLTGMILDVVVGGAAPSLAGLRALAKADPHLRLHVDSQAMGDLMAAADFAIGAGGSSTWERATLGLPTVSVILADNQRPMAKAMAKAGLTLAADAADTEFEARLAQAARQLAEDAALRRAISERVSALCDGLGAERFANRLLGPGGRGLDTVQRPHDG